ncbi:hypothetical protein WOB59_04345 [Methylocystis sp. IM4]|uniref:hypothetical protein n=1 Tax=Methylocystis sp. IM4 TaxID=3136560 RepID=UPI003119DC12
MAKNKYGGPSADELFARDTSKGKLTLRFKKSEGDLLSNYALFIDKKRISTDNFSSIGDVWETNGDVTVLLHGHAGTAAAWCNLFHISSSKVSEIGELSACDDLIAKVDHKTKTITITTANQDEKADTEVVTVRRGVVEKTIKHAKWISPDARKAGPDGEVTRWNGGSLAKLLHEDGEIVRLMSIMPEEDVKQLHQMLMVESCTIKGGFLFCHSYGKGVKDDFALTISVRDGDPFVAILGDVNGTPTVTRFSGGVALPAVVQDGKTMLYGTSLQSTPAPISQWLREEHGIISTALKPLADQVIGLSKEAGSKVAAIEAMTTKQLFEAATATLSRSKIMEKDEFETTAEFSQRKRSATACDGILDKDIPIRLDGFLSGKYDADNEEYIFRELPYLKSEREARVEGPVEVTERKSYVAENAFGKAAVVELKKGEKYNLALRGPIIEIPRLKLPHLQAREIIKDIRVILYVRLADPFVRTVLFHQKPTLDHPVEFFYNNHDVIAKPVKLVFYRESDGNVLFELSDTPPSRLPSATEAICAKPALTP